ncbi:PREDICTED: uncharacterized protein LOC108762044 [Trachymyrmex cornetzi]|uniref:uncharacterized protein LOC108762044 n=1 Tax=Trachymyrmex cornetzi TaxID=471704 RepID=UPI00084F8453|nr:PREDICTED: uncharacterized protein LOC108762044 [Trachymyrmex cornetzi]
MSSIKKSLEQLLRLQTTCNLDIKDIKQRLTKLENRIKNRALSPYDDSLIVQLLPLVTINNIKEFDSMLKTSNEAVTHFKRFISKIGGNNPRDNIHSTLKKIFTNGCAINCSWKGIRNHFRLDNLQFVIIIKREITLHHMTLTETEFDNIAAEWFRFAKQRQRRAEKGKDKENQREEKTRENKEKEGDKENENLTNA